jgi:site-specific DNA recombinase
VRLGIYVRISKDPEGNSTSPARQEQDCRSFAQLHGHEVARVYSDADLSAYTGIDRPGYEELKRFAQ